MKVAQVQLYQPPSGFGAGAQPDRAKVTTRWEGRGRGQGGTAKMCSCPPTSYINPGDPGVPDL